MALRRSKIIKYFLITLAAVSASIVTVEAQSWPVSATETLEDIENNSDFSKLDITYLAKSKGFIVDSHNVKTQDGYILTVHRLVNPLMAKNKTRGLVVIQHGILCASSIFLLNSSPNPSLDKPKLIKSPFKPNATMSNSLAIALVNRGYDVWLTNFRGTQYGSNHQELTTEDPDFWAYNADSLIANDLADSVSYILNVTKAPTYTYVAHSLGTTVGLGTLLVHKDSPVVKNLSCSILMAPVASTKYMKGGLLPVFRMATLFYDDLAPFPGNSRTFATFTRRMCLIMPRWCTWMSSMILGDYQRDPGRNASHADQQDHQNQINAFVMMMHQSVSVQLLKHIVQVNRSGKLCRYNYGQEPNLKRYGCKESPQYNLTQIKQPHLKMALVSGATDVISTPGEVKWIKRQFHNNIGLMEDIRIPVDPFNHMDLVLSKDAGKLVNKRVVNFMETNKCSRGPIAPIVSKESRAVTSDRVDEKPKHNPVATSEVVEAARNL